MTKPYTLYTRPDTGGFVIHAALEKAGADYRIVTNDKSRGDHETEEFLKLNPMGKVPVLGLPDGSHMTESAAIIIHLAERFPQAGLCPAPGSPSRPHFLRWLIFCAVNLYTADLRYYYPERHTSDPDGIEGVKAAALADMDRQFGILDDAIGTGTYLLDADWSIADVYAAMLAYWHPDPAGLFAACPRLSRLCEHIRNIDCVKAANAYHGNIPAEATVTG